MARRISAADWKLVAEFISDEASRRQNKRKHLEKVWKEIDRQLRMEPMPKLDEEGKPLTGAGWMSALELPLQAGALELLNSDSRRLMFPTEQNFFSAHSAINDEEIRDLEESIIVPGLDEFSKRAVEAINPGQKQKIDQDALDEIVEGSLNHHHGLYDFRGAWDNLNAEALKYGTLVGRMAMVRPDVSYNQFRGTSKNPIPVVIPQSIKNTLLDDTMIATLHEGLMIGPSTIYRYWHTLEDLRKAAAKGSKDPASPTGGWMGANLRGLEPLSEDTRSIQVLKYEGDLLVPRSTGQPIFVENVMISVVVGKSDSKTTSRVFRYQEQAFPFRSTFHHPYHQEDLNSPYGSSPLMKGMPVQAAASDALNKTMDAAALKNKPPVAWNPQDHYLEAMGGPDLFPGAQWKAQKNSIEVFDRIGDPSAMFAIFSGLLQQYADVTGVSAPRLGAQTKSHQTAFAIDTEQTRGMTRTTDYVRSVNQGPMQTMLSMEYEMIRENMKKTMVYLPKQRGYIEIDGSMLPSVAWFEPHGAGGPIEEQELLQTRFAALQQALQIEVQRRDAGEQGMDFEAVQKEILEKGMWQDVEKFFASADTPPEGGPGVPGSSGIISEEPLAALAQLQGGG